MLTAELVRVREEGERLEPSFISAKRRDLVDAITDLLGIVGQAREARWTRGALDEALDERSSTHRSRRTLVGLARLLLSDATFEVDSPVPPDVLRQAAFAAARQRGPIALPGDQLGRLTADDILADVGAPHGLSAAQAGAALYADLPENHALTAIELPTVQRLIDRYNVALVQALLIRALEVEVTLSGPSVARVRQVLRKARFHQLMYRARRDDGDLTLTLDGPTSLFQQSTRYGLNLAFFFPVLLHQTTPWRLRARVLWGPARTPRTLEISQANGLIPTTTDAGGWTTPEQKAFSERWEALGDTGWTMSTETVPIILGHKGVVLPDFTFRKDGREAHLDIVGFWRKTWLQGHLSSLTDHGPGNLVVAVSSRLHVDEEAFGDFPGAVVPFKQIVPAKAVLAALEQVAR